MYAWVIDKNYVDDFENVSGPSGAEKLLMDKLRAGDGQKFRMFDGDGELYYTGRVVGEFEGFEPLDDYGMPNAGCTEIHYKDFCGAGWQPL